MRFIIMFLVCIEVAELISLERFSDEISKSALINNYDVVFVDLNEPILSLLSGQLKLPKSIYRSSCSAFKRNHVLYFLENITDPLKNFTACAKSHVLPILMYRNFSDSTKAIQASTLLLRRLKIARAIHVVYDPLHMNLTLFPYSYLPFDEPQSIENLVNPNPPINIDGYVYTVHYTKLFPFTYHWTSKDHSEKLAGLDTQLIESIAAHQNATVRYVFDPKSGTRCPALDLSVDFNIRRLACPMISADRLYLPQWDAVCVVVPKRHERLIMIQFAKPFQLEVWIFVLIFLIARFWFRFDRWHLLLLAVVLIEFLLTASYEVKVIQYMTTLRYAPNPRTMADLINRGERFVVGAPEVEVLVPYGSAINMHIVTASKESYIGKMAMLYYCGSAEAFFNSYINYNPVTNDRLAILLPERISPYATSFGFARSHPLRGRFERVLSWVFETGIWRKIYDQYAMGEQQFQPLVTPGEYLIEFGDFKPLWMVGAVGWMLSFVVFLAEMMWAQVQKCISSKVKILLD